MHPTLTHVRAIFSRVLFRASNVRWKRGTSAFEESPSENSMGLLCGDFTHDGFPEVILGTGAPSWGLYDVPLCNVGGDPWLGFERCDQHTPEEQGVLRRGHGPRSTC